MEIPEARERLQACEALLDQNDLVEFGTFETGKQQLQLFLTPGFKRNCRKKRVWKSKAFFITLKNVKYGIDPLNFRSPGGKDGIFIIDRHYTPRNSMQRKLFDQFIDKESSGFSVLLDQLKWTAEQVNAVRVVSHHMRLLGIHQRKNEKDIVVLVDYDQDK